MSNELALPQSTEMTVNTDQVGGVPYLTFFSPKSPKASDYRLLMPDIKEPDPFLVLPAPLSPIKLPSLQFFAVSAKQAWVDADEDTGEVNRVRYEEDEDAAFKECIESVLLVFGPDGKLYPARCSFRTTKCNGMKVVCKAAKLAEDKDQVWSKQSPEHAASMKVPMAWGRFVATMTTQQRTAKASGRKYFLTQALIKPVTPAQVSTLVTCLKDQDWLKGYQAVNAAYMRRLTELDSHLDA